MAGVARRPGGAPMPSEEAPRLLYRVAEALDYLGSRLEYLHGRAPRRNTLANVLHDASGSPVLDWSVAELATAPERGRRRRPVPVLTRSGSLRSRMPCAGAPLRDLRVVARDRPPTGLAVSANEDQVWVVSKRQIFVLEASIT